MYASEVFLTVQSDTKEEENNILKGFLDRLNYFDVKLNDSECPDFDVKIDNVSIGIKVTKYFNDFKESGSQKQKELSSWIKEAKSFKEILKKENKKYSNCYGAFHFINPECNFKKEILNNSNLFKELLSLIEETINDKKKDWLYKIEINKYPALGEKLEQIFLTYTENDSLLWWNLRLQSGEIINTCNNSIKKIVDAKNIKAKKYENKFTQKWLLVYAGGLSLSDMFIIPDSNVSKIQRSGQNLYIETIKESFGASDNEFHVEINSNYFTHVFIWDKFSEKIFMLYPYYKKILDCAEKKIWINHLPIPQQSKR